MEAPLLSLQAPFDAGKAMAERAKALRLLRAWTRETLARRAGVSAASLKRFETSGAASLALVLRAAFALGRLEDFAHAFDPPEVATLAELRARCDRPLRKRGRSCTGSWTQAEREGSRNTIPPPRRTTGGGDPGPTGKVCGGQK
jgi:transcriptional regulator with XRE-family HTH domain